MKAFLNWSGGKDSAYCLYRTMLVGNPVSALVTTLNAQGQVSMHGVRRTLLEKQAASVQLPLHTIELPEDGGLSGYESAIHQSNAQLLAQGFTQALSGDLFLQDLRTYRETLYAKDGIGCRFPLWEMDTRDLVKDFIAQGFKAVIVCVDSALLSADFCGRLLDADFINDLPPGVDPCGENGEYHSFVFDGQVFEEPVRFSKGAIVHRTYPAPKAAGNDCFKRPQPAADFYYCDLLDA